MGHSKMSVTVPDEILKEIKEISTSRNTRLSHLVTEALLDKIRIIPFKNQYPRPPRLPSAMSSGRMEGEADPPAMQGPPACQASRGGLARAGRWRAGRNQHPASSP